MTKREERRARTILLLSSRTAWFPSRAPRNVPQAGFVHRSEARESCPDCLANDRRTKGCESCGGRGYLDVWRERDPYAKDKIEPYGMSRDRHERRRARDAEIERLKAQVRPPFSSEADALAEANQHPERWERERDRHYRNGDYRALDLALEWLGERSPEARQLVEWVYEFEVIAAPQLKRACELGVDLVATRLPDPIRVPSWLSPKHPAQIRRDKQRAA